MHSFKLKTANVPVTSNNHLVLTIAKPATIWLDMVSLFPPTYKGRSEGNRIDLMEKLAAMHPTFLRLPGGNYLEGDHIADRFDWKKTDRRTRAPGAIARPTAWGCSNSSSGVRI
jgi:alpha-N-arabinofuranosidase